MKTRRKKPVWRGQTSGLGVVHGRVFEHVEGGETLHIGRAMFGR